MWLVDFLARRIQRVAISNLTLVILIGQIFVYGISMVSQATGRFEDPLVVCGLEPQAVFQGEWWRIITFVFIPPLTNVIFFFFYCAAFYLMGSALESYWGTARYNVFLGVGYAATVIAALATTAITGINAPASNGFVNGTVFLAFAQLYPEFVFVLYFLFPIKAKWLARIEWTIYLAIFALGDWMTRTMIAASVANFFLFFGGDVLRHIRGQRRAIKWRTRQLSAARLRHHCTVCGINSETHPEMDFRYCSKCAGNLPYCSEHLRNHEHVVEATVEKS